MALVKKDSIMEIFIGVSLLQVDPKEKVFIGGLMDLFIKVGFKVVYFMEREYGVQNKMITMKASINSIVKMGWEHIDGVMVSYLRGYLKMMRRLFHILTCQFYKPTMKKKQGKKEVKRESQQNKGINITTDIYFSTLRRL